MIVYNITFHIEKDIVEDCLCYLKQQYIPTAASSGFLLKPCLRRILVEPGEEGESYAVQFHAKNMDTLNYWMEQEGITLHQQLIERFGTKVVGFTTFLEELDLE